MDEHDHDQVITADETVVEHLGSEEQIEGSFCAGNVEEDDGGEIMVEVVGSDVLVDGVSSHGGGDELREDNLGRERESIDGVACVSSEFDPQDVGDLGNRELNVRIESGLNRVEEIESSLGEQTCDVVPEETEPMVIEEGLEGDKEGGPTCDLSSCTVGVLEGEVRNSGIEKGVGASASGFVMVKEESLNCKDEALDSSALEVNLPCTAKDQSSSVDIVIMEIDDGVIVGNAAVLDQQVEVSVGAEVDKEEKLHSAFEAMETDIGGNLISSVDGAAMEDKTSSDPKAGDDDVDLCLKTDSSSEQNQAVGGNEDTVIDRKVQSPEAEVPTTHMDGMVCTEDGSVEQDPSLGTEVDDTSILGPNSAAFEENKGEELVFVLQGEVEGESCKADENVIVGSHDLEADECTMLGSNAGPEVQVEDQHNKGKQVDSHREQGTEVKEQSIEFEQSTAVDEMTLLPPESEGEFSVSDLVWGKVRSHPWWPGQIFDPADASEKATKYHKKDCFLVAYFGDRTFAWNDASLLKPFMKHFSQIDKQSNSEAFHVAITSTLGEVSRRVQLGLTCSCIPKDSAYEMIESQIVENAGIRAESSRRYGVDKSSGVNSFQPNKLVGKIRALAKSPFEGVDQLELAVSKAQLLAFSRFKGSSGLPEFQLCGGLLENNADTSQLSEDATPISEESEGILKSERRSSHKRKHKLADSLYPRKKERPISELMSEAMDSMDSEDEDGPDSHVTSKSVSSSSNRKRKAIDSVGEGSDKRISFYAAKVSTTASSSPIPKPSFRVGECIRRVASQLTGSPSLLKSSGQNSPEDDESGDLLAGFEDSFQTPDNSQKGKIIVTQEDSSVDEMLVQLRSAARDPMKGYGVLKSIIPFFSSFRHSIASGQHSVKRNSSTTGKIGGGGGRKKKVLNAAIATPKEFEFDDVNESNDSYWTDRVVQNYDEEQPLDNGQNGGESQPLALEPDKPRKPGRRSYKRKQFSSGNHEVEAEEQTEHIEARKPVVLPPTGLILNFGEGGFVPSEMTLNKMFKRFGALKESETEVDRQANRARVVFKKGSDAEVAFNSAAKFNIFGSTVVNYELSYLQSLSFKSMPLETLQGLEDAT